MEFTVDRSKWVCGDADPINGRGKGGTSMLNEESFMCCLGHVQLQINPKVELFRCATPSDTYNNMKIDKKKYKKEASPEKIEENPLIEDFYTGTMDSSLSNEAICINDDKELNLPQREKALREVFAEYGHKIKFIGRSVKPQQ